MVLDHDWRLMIGTIEAQSNVRESPSPRLLEKREDLGSQGMVLGVFLRGPDEVWTFAQGSRRTPVRDVEDRHPAAHRGTKIGIGAVIR